MEYRPKIVDGQLDLRMEAFGAVQIVGPKGCGKTTTAKQRAKTIIEFQDEDKRDRYLQVAEEMPSRLLRGEKPVLFDEWQDARPQDDHNRHRGRVQKGRWHHGGSHRMPKGPKAVSGPARSQAVAIISDRLSFSKSG